MATNKPPSPDPEETPAPEPTPPPAPAIQPPAPSYTGPLDSTDKTGETISVGDTVEAVYGGDRHVGIVKRLEEELGSLVAHIETTARVPVTLTRKVAADTDRTIPPRRRSGT